MNPVMNLLNNNSWFWWNVFYKAKYIKELITLNVLHIRLRCMIQKRYLNIKLCSKYIIIKIHTYFNNGRIIKSSTFFIYDKSYQMLIAFVILIYMHMHIQYIYAFMNIPWTMSSVYDLLELTACIYETNVLQSMTNLWIAKNNITFYQIGNPKFKKKIQCCTYIERTSISYQNMAQ